MAVNPFYLATKSLLNDTVQAATAIAIGTAVDHNGNQISTAGVDAWGIALENANVGDYIPITVAGTVAVLVGAAISALGTPLTTDSQGRMVPATAGSGSYVLGRARGVATAAGLYIEMLVTREGHA